MTNRPVEFGDPLPPPPEDGTQYDSNRQLGRIGYSMRAKLARMFNPPPEEVAIPQKDLVIRLLVIQLERIGDLVLTEPALRALRLQFPHAERTLIAQSFAREIFGGSGWGEFAAIDQLPDIKRQKKKFDLVVDLTGRVEMKIARSLKKSRIPVRIGLERGGRGVYFTHPIELPDITVPTREIYLGLAEKTGAEREDDIPRLPCGEDRIQRGNETWAQHDYNNPAVIMPGAHYPSQRWSIENFAKVADVIKRKDLDVAVITGPGEKELGDKLADDLSVLHIATPSLSGLMDLLATSSVVLCNNTGPLHIAAALNAPTVSTMGPTVPWRWWPKSEAPSIVFRGGSKKAEGNLDNIDPMEFAAAALHLAELKE